MRNRLHFPVARLMLGLLSLPWLAGCLYTHGPPEITLEAEDIPAIRFGMNLDEVVSALEGRTYWRFIAPDTGDSWPYNTRAKYERTVTHQFTILGDDGSEIVGVKSRVIEPSFVLVFVDGRLAKILQSYGLTSFSQPSSVAARLLDTGSLTLEEFAATIQREVERENRIRKYLEPPPVPLFWPLVLSNELRSENNALAKYDAFALHLGMSQSEVADTFGEPTSREVLSGAETRWVYIAPVSRLAPPITVSLRFAADRLRAVYTQAR